MQHPTICNPVLEMALNEAKRYRDHTRPRSPRPTATTEELRQALNIDLPAQRRESIDVIQQLRDAATTGLLDTAHPNFFGWVMGASSESGVAADIMTSAWGQNAGLYQTAPSAAIAEEAASRWLLDLLDLPAESSIGFTTGATMASFIGLAAARGEVLRRHGWDIDECGLMGAPAVTVIVSAEAHASVLAVLKYLGFGRRSLTQIPVDEEGRMQVPALAKVMEVVEGPCIVVAQAGHINSGAFDRFEEIANLTQQRRAWLHIDGAFGLWARCSPELKSKACGAELADSWAVDGHKWLQVPYDSGYAIVKDADAHRRAMMIDASYLNRSEADGRHPSEYCPELSRRARGFATWAVLQTLGRQGIRELIEHHCDCARHLAKRLKHEPGIRVLNSVCLNQLALTFENPYASRSSSQSTLPVNASATDDVISAIQKENTSFVSGAEWKGHRILRVSIVSENTSIAAIDQLADSLIRAWRSVKEYGCETGDVAA
ncbi:MAG: aminotransferase class V-fold PLP-dependent enzyme [Granulosicoccus sp.]|nr:aminotransferase class V-fold PLP-dependent enzyme [Granulosicoccus sp.]